MRVARFGSIAGLAIALTFTAGALQAQGAAAICKDGTKSATSGRGACSGHGGVDDAATAAAKKNAKGAEKAAKSAEKAADKSAKAADKAADKAEKTADKAAAKTAMKTVGSNTDTKVQAKTAAAATKAEEKADKDAAGAIAQCKDGTYSHAKSTRGACSSHGGIAKTLKP